MSVKFFARNSGAGNGCANFMGALKNCVLSAGKTTMPIKFLVLGEGGGWGFFGGGEVYTREMGTICPFGVFFPCFTVFLLQNWPLSL